MRNLWLGILYTLKTWTDRKSPALPCYDPANAELGMGYASKKSRYTHTVK